MTVTAKDQVIQTSFDLIYDKLIKAYEKNWIMEDVRGKTDLDTVYYYHLIILYVLLLYLYTLRVHVYDEDVLNNDMYLDKVRECVKCEYIDLDSFISANGIVLSKNEPNPVYNLAEIRNFVYEPDNCICFLDPNTANPRGLRILVTTTSRTPILANRKNILI